MNHSFSTCLAVALCATSALASSANLQEARPAPAILRADAASERMFPFVISYDAPELVLPGEKPLVLTAGSYHFER